MHVTVRFFSVAEFNSLTVLYIKSVAYLKYECKMYFFLLFIIKFILLLFNIEEERNKTLLAQYARCFVTFIGTFLVAFYRKHINEIAKTA